MNKDVDCMLQGRPSKATPEEQMEFKCNECDWVLSDETDLQNHMIQFHGFKPNASSREHVDEVIEMIKNDDPLTCSACNLTFKRPSETFSHRKVIIISLPRLFVFCL